MKIISWYESGRSENDQSENIADIREIMKLIGAKLNLFENLELALNAITPPLNLLVANHPSREDMMRIGEYVTSHPDIQVIITRGSMSTLCETISEYNGIFPSGLTKSSSYPQIGFTKMFDVLKELENIVNDYV